MATFTFSEVNSSPSCQSICTVTSCEYFIGSGIWEFEMLKCQYIYSCGDEIWSVRCQCHCQSNI